MDIRKLAELAAMPVRNVRYLISRDFVDGPDTSAGPVNAVYTDRHLKQLRMYQTLRDAGYSQEEIRAKAAGRTLDEVALRLPEVIRHVAPGIDLKVVPELVPADLDRSELVQRILGALEVLGISTEGKVHADGQDKDRRSAGEAQGRRSRLRQRSR